MKTDEKVLEKSMGGWAFYPFLILAGIVVARIIYNIAAGLPQSGNSLPITAVTLVAAVCSLLIGNGKVMERVDAFSPPSPHRDPPSSNRDPTAPHHPIETP